MTKRRRPGESIHHLGNVKFGVFALSRKFWPELIKKLTGHPSSIDLFINLDKIGAISGPACLKYLGRTPSGAVAFYIESF